MYLKKKKQFQQIDFPYSVQIEKNNSLVKFRGPCGNSSLRREKIDKKGCFILSIEKKIFSYRRINFIETSDFKKFFFKKTETPSIKKEYPFFMANFLHTSSVDSHKKGGKKSLLEWKKILFERRDLFLPSFKKLIINNKLLINKAFGVAFGYSIFLQLIGLGYRFSVQSAPLDTANNKISRPPVSSTQSVRLQTELNSSYTSYLEQYCHQEQPPFSYNFLNNNKKNSPVKNMLLEKVSSGVTLTITAGFSHKIKYIFPPSFRVFQLKFPRNKICLFGIDKDDVLNCASQIKQVHPPSTYKGKGIRINNEIAKVRPGKKNK